MSYNNPTKTVGDVGAAVKRIFGDESGVQLVDNDIVVWTNEAQHAIADSTKVVKAQGKTLMPGLIDCHVHVIAAHLNLNITANQPNVFATLRALPIMKGMLMRGFTTVRDAGGGDWNLAEATRTDMVEGPRIFAAGRALSQTGGHGDGRPRSDVIEPCGCSSRVGALAREVS